MNAPNFSAVLAAIKHEAAAEEKAVHERIRNEMERFIDHEQYGGVCNLLTILSEIMQSRTQHDDDYEDAYHSIVECAAQCDLRYDAEIDLNAAAKAAREVA